jgi:hypothetical protein
MNITLTPELEELRAAVRKFVTAELEPLARVIDDTGEMPEEAVTLLARNGYLGMRLDEAYGGAGVGLSHYCLVLEELARSHRAYTTLVGTTSGNTPTAIQSFGTEEQRRNYLPGLTDDTRRTAFALTEPEAGDEPIPGTRSAQCNIAANPEHRGATTTWPKKPARQWCGRRSTRRSSRASTRFRRSKTTRCSSRSKHGARPGRGGLRHQHDGNRARDGCRPCDRHR